jgi:hypothetical protein
LDFEKEEKGALVTQWLALLTFDLEGPSSGPNHTPKKKKKLPFWQIQHHAYIFQNGKIFCQNGNFSFEFFFNIFYFGKIFCHFGKKIAILENYFRKWKNIFQNGIFFQNGRIFFHFGKYFSKKEEYFPI